ncbi:hypothetical protein LY76DRAFT_221222 [Colletotrichum caudatum]|nr:hypothetical protein LY76DRAFT_221222 [Colletotrichum caudatum]
MRERETERMRRSQSDCRALAQPAAAVPGVFRDLVPRCIWWPSHLAQRAQLEWRAMDDEGLGREIPRCCAHHAEILKCLRTTQPNRTLTGPSFARRHAIREMDASSPDAERVAIHLIIPRHQNKQSRCFRRIALRSCDWPETPVRSVGLAMLVACCWARRVRPILSQSPPVARIGGPGCRQKRASGEEGGPASPASSARSVAQRRMLRRCYHVTSRCVRDSPAAR